MLRDVTPVILAGGSGTRLRPLTGVNRPKPFLKAFSSNSLLQETLLRGAGMGRPVVVVHARSGKRARDEMQALGINGQVICEPAPRSTAPAIALAALSLVAENKPMLVMPSDHYIDGLDLFEASVVAALERLSGEAVRAVLLGATARRAATRYGYIHSDAHGAVQSFIEKPDAPHARQLLGLPQCFWNTGMFLMRPSDYLAALKAFEPVLYRGVCGAFVEGARSDDFLLANNNIYAKLKGLAVDYAVMERLPGLHGAIYVEPLQAFWQDVGCWRSLVGAKMKSLAK